MRYSANQPECVSVWFDLSNRTLARSESCFKVSIDSNVEIEFELEIEDAHRAPVLVGGTLVGQITVVGSGEGKLEMSTDPDIDQVDLPVDFPSVEVGTTVLVEGLLEGTFAVPAA